MIAIFGRDYPTPDGTAIRDYVHVADLASAHIKAIQYLLQGGASVALNVGTGRGASVAEVIAAAERAVGHNILKTVDSRRGCDPPYLVADPRRMQQLLGWQATRSDLNTILVDAWAWHRKRFGGAAGPLGQLGSVVPR